MGERAKAMQRLDRLIEAWDRFQYRWACLHETWQPGYSLSYRCFRLREAFSPLSEEWYNKQ